MGKAKILVVAGSMRRDSWNKKLARIAAAEAKKAGGEVTLVELEDFNLPLYNGDDEAENGLPDGAKKLKEAMFAHNALLFVSPEYNSSVPGVFKNAIDWASRPEGDEPSVAAFRGKVAAIMSASPGFLGGLRGLVHLRSILGNISVTVIPQQMSLSKAHEAFDEEGSLKDTKQLAKVTNITAALVETTEKLAD